MSKAAGVHNFSVWERIKGIMAQTMIISFYDSFRGVHPYSKKLINYALWVFGERSPGALFFCLRIEKRIKICYDITVSPEASGRSAPTDLALATLGKRGLNEFTCHNRKRFLQNQIRLSRIVRSPGADSA